MTVRKYSAKDLVRREPTDIIYQGHKLDHINIFKNGVVVGYEDADEQEFLVVLKSRDIL